MYTHDELGFYAAPGPMTTMPVNSRLLADAEERVEELETRSVKDMISLIDRLDPFYRPLVQSREPEHRLIGNCRQFSVLTCGLLRHAGVPARARAGFAKYFGADWIDHWIVERWDAGRHRWIRTDPQLDEYFQNSLELDFDAPCPPSKPGTCRRSRRARRRPGCRAPPPGWSV